MSKTMDNDHKPSIPTLHELVASVNQAAEIERLKAELTSVTEAFRERLHDKNVRISDLGYEIEAAKTEAKEANDTLRARVEELEGEINMQLVFLRAELEELRIDYLAVNKEMVRRGVELEYIKGENMTKTQEMFNDLVDECKELVAENARLKQELDHGEHHKTIAALKAELAATVKAFNKRGEELEAYERPTPKPVVRTYNWAVRETVSTEPHALDGKKAYLMHGATNLKLTFTDGKLTSAEVVNV